MHKLNDRIILYLRTSKKKSRGSNSRNDHAFPYRLSSFHSAFNVSLASTVHLAAIMIYEAAPLSRTVSAKLEMRPYIHEPSTFFEIASFASASPTYRSIMRPLNVPRPLLHPGSFAMWPGRPPRRPRRATCRVVGRLECAYTSVHGIIVLIPGTVSRLY